MKFSEHTLALIGALAQLNDGLIFKPGNKLRTKNIGSSILAEAKLQQDIPQEFAITDLRRFLAAINMFGDPDVEITPTHVILRSETEEFKYTCANPLVIVAPPEGNIKRQEVIDEVNLDKTSLTRLIKAIGMLGEAAENPEIVFTGHNGRATVKVTDTRNKSCPVYSKDLGAARDDYEVVFSADKFKFNYPADYKISISQNMVFLESDDIWYAVMADIKR